MKHLLITFFILLLSFGLFSCKGNKAISTGNPEETLMYTKVGEDMCECMKPLLKLMGEIENKNPDEISEFTLEIQQVSYAAEDCILELKEKYPSVDFEEKDNPKTEKALLENCPAYKKATEKKKG